jgi:hypothetical protein
MLSFADFMKKQEGGGANEDGGYSEGTFTMDMATAATAAAAAVAAYHRRTTAFVPFLG